MTEFLLDGWRVEPRRNRVSRRGAVRSLEPREMDLLVRLVAGGGEVVSKEELLEDVWGGRAVVEHVVPKTISKLRLALGESAAAPRIIRTQPRRGYRIACPVETVARARDRRLGARWFRPRVAAVAATALVWVGLPALMGSLLPRSSAPHDARSAAPAAVEEKLPIKLAIEPRIEIRRLESDEVHPATGARNERWEWSLTVRDSS